MNKLGILFALSLLIFACKKETITEPQATINYYNFVPDTLIVDSMMLDVNQDLTADIKLKVYKDLQGISPSGGPYYNYFARCISVNPNVEISMGTATDPNQQIWNCLEFDSLISNNLTWRSSFFLNGRVIAAGFIGIWDTNNPTDYLAVKVQQSGSTYFGWIKLTTLYNANLDKRYRITCFEYALSADNLATIRAGQR